MKQWWVIYFPAKFLEQIEKAIEREEFDIEWYCPKRKIVSTHNGLVRTTEVPMYFNYMFWYYDPEIHILEYENLRKYIVFKPLMWKKKMVSVSKELIEAIRRREQLEELKFDSMRNDTTYLQSYIGRQVHINDGPFMGTTGTITGIRRAGMLVIEVLVFNRPVACNVSVDYAELL